MLVSAMRMSRPFSILGLGLAWSGLVSPRIYPHWVYLDGTVCFGCEPCQPRSVADPGRVPGAAGARLWRGARLRRHAIRGADHRRQDPSAARHAVPDDLPVG